MAIMANEASIVGFNSKLSSSFPVRFLQKIGGQELHFPNELILSTCENGLSEIVVDYGRAEGGMPFFETSQVKSNGPSVSIDVIYSETASGVEKDNGLTCGHISRTKLTFCRRRTILSVLQCHGYIPAQYTHIRAHHEYAIRRITVCTEVPTISENIIEDSKLLHQLFICWIPPVESTAPNGKLLQMF